VWESRVEGAEKGYAPKIISHFLLGKDVVIVQKKAYRAFTGADTPDVF
jgi:hypothetical protein